MMLQIVSNTPLWVWGLLIALVALGASQFFTRQASLTRVTFLPAAMAALSLYGTVSVFGAAAAVLLLWGATAVLAAMWVARRPVPARTLYDAATRRFVLPGSALPMLIILGIFCTKYAVGVLLALQPLMRTDAVFAEAVAALYGLFSGTLAGRALRLWRLARAPYRGD